MTLMKELILELMLYISRTEKKMVGEYLFGMKEICKWELGKMES